MQYEDVVRMLESNDSIEAGYAACTFMAELVSNDPAKFERVASLLHDMMGHTGLSTCTVLLRQGILKAFSHTVAFCSEIRYSACVMQSASFVTSIIVSHRELCAEAIRAGAIDVLVPLMLDDMAACSSLRALAHLAHFEPGAIVASNVLEMMPLRIHAAFHNGDRIDNIVTAGHIANLVTDVCIDQFPRKTCTLKVVLHAVLSKIQAIIGEYEAVYNQQQCCGFAFFEDAKEVEDFIQKSLSKLERP